jgi:hypothetical protein
LAADACATHARTGHDGKLYDPESVHVMELAALHDEFAEVADTAVLLEKLE